MGLLLADWSVELFRARRKKAKKAKMVGLMKEKLENMENMEEMEEVVEAVDRVAEDRGPNDRWMGERVACDQARWEINVRHIHRPDGDGDAPR